MIQINLIPDVKLELLKAQRMRGVVISASILASIIAVGVVAVLLIYMFVVQGARHLSLNDNIEKGSAKIESIENLSGILTIQSQLAAIDELNDQKYMATRTFDLLSAITLPSPNVVVYNSIVLSAPGQDAAAEDSSTGTISIDGQTDSFATLEIFKKTIENAIVEYQVVDTELSKDGQEVLKTETTKVASNVELGEVSYGEDSSGNRVLRFTIKFAYAPEFFSPASRSIVVKIDINGNVTDSYLNIPRFTERAGDIKEEE